MQTDTYITGVEHADRANDNNAQPIRQAAHYIHTQTHTNQIK